MSWHRSYLKPWLMAFLGLAQPVWALADEGPAQGAEAGAKAKKQAAPPAVVEARVPVRKVALFSSGVGYFEHAGAVQGGSQTELRFKTTQINDILKSLVLEDLAGGRVGTIVYPSQDPIEKTLGSFQINIHGNPSLADILNQLRGAKLTVKLQGETIQGAILGAEKRSTSVGPKKTLVDTWFVNLIADGGIRSVGLDEMLGMELQDPRLQQELTQALTALSQARDQEKKPVLIQFQGEGQRQVRLGYVVEAPIWKTSYRLVFGADAKAPAKLQGWAIVENQTDNDWNNISLSLVSGRPISFVQELYQPLYTRRPVVTPELFAGLNPQLYDEGIDKLPREQLGRRLSDREEKFLAANRNWGDMPEAAGGMMGGGGAGRFRGINPTSSVAALASSGKLGELFQYTVHSVSLPRQRSAMIPIVTDSVELERLSIFNAKALASHPLNGARVKNTSGKHLLQGPVTVLDGSAYAGDARIDDLPPGQERLISYAIDLEVNVQATEQPQSAVLETVGIVNGALRRQQKMTRTTEYVINSKATKDKTIVVECPVIPGWALVDTVKPRESTEALHRFEDQLKAGATKKLVVKQQASILDALAILDLNVTQLVFYQRNEALGPKVREALAEAIRRRQELASTQDQIRRLQADLKTYPESQNRIRENMKTVKTTAPYYQRLLKKLNDQESEIENLNQTLAQRQAEERQQQADLNSYVMGLAIE